MSLDQPDFVGAARSALQQMPQQTGPAAQAPQPPAPVAPLPQTFFGRLLQGALNGLAGGIQQGQENMAGAGTPGFHPNGNGLAYAQQLQARQDQEKQQQAAAANQQNQQQFENQRSAFKDQQEAQMQQAQRAQTLLNGIHQVQQIHHATQDEQDKYDAEQKAQIDDAAANGITQHVIKPAPGQTPQEAGAAWLKANPDHATNAHVNYQRDADGNITSIVVSEDDPNRQVSAADVNRGLKSTGSSLRVPDGSSMTLRDARHLYSQEGAKQADMHNQMALERLKSNLELGRQTTIEKMKENSNGHMGEVDPTSGSNPQVESLVDDIRNGKTTLQQATKGMGKDAAQAAKVIAARFNAKYPDDIGLAQREQMFKRVTTNNFQQQGQAAAELFGTNGQDGSGKTIGAMNEAKQILQRIPKASNPLQSLLEQRASYWTGNPDMAALHKIAPDIALRYARFASGGGPSSDAQFKAITNSLESAETPQAWEQSFAALEHIGGETLNSLKGNNPYAQRALSHINDPGTDNSENPSGAGGSGTAVSLSKARQLPQYRGKSDDVIKADITKHGHQVKD